LTITNSVLSAQGSYYFKLSSGAERKEWLRSFGELSVQTEVTYKVALCAQTILSGAKLLKRVEKNDQRKRQLKEDRKRFKDDMERKKAQLDEKIAQFNKERAAFDKQKTTLSSGSKKD